MYVSHDLMIDLGNAMFFMPVFVRSSDQSEVGFLAYAQHPSGCPFLGAKPYYTKPATSSVELLTLLFSRCDSSHIHDFPQNPQFTRCYVVLANKS